MRPNDFSAFTLRLFRLVQKVSLIVALLISVNARGEAMLQLFNVNWNELSAKMPEIAEAGYTSLWLPPPAKARVTRALAHRNTAHNIRLIQHALLSGSNHRATQQPHPALTRA